MFIMDIDLTISIILIFQSRPAQHTAQRSLLLWSSTWFHVISSIIFFKQFLFVVFWCNSWCNCVHVRKTGIYGVCFFDRHFNFQFICQQVVSCVIFLACITHYNDWKQEKNQYKRGRSVSLKLDKQNLFTLVNSKVLCLVCRNVVSVPNEYNLRRRFETQHPNLAELDASEKKLKA